MKTMLKFLFFVCFLGFFTFAGIVSAQSKGNQINLEQSEILPGEIVFVSARDGDHEIFRMDGSEDNLQKLTDNTTEDMYPSWSPDGSRIVYQSGTEVYIMNADGSGKALLTYSGPSSEPAWSPDGAQIVLQRSTGNAELFLINPDGTNLRQLTITLGYDNYAPDWSPDGQQIVFTSRRVGNVAGIWRMNSDGTQQQALTGSWDSYPSWSPDGTKIAFMSYRAGNDEIYVMNADGTDQTRLTTNEFSDINPKWSSDGQYILFSSNRSGNQDLYMITADGTEEVRLTTHIADDRWGVWKPNSSVAPVVIVQPTDQQVAVGDPVTFTAAASGVPEPTIEWQLSTDGGGTWNNIPNEIGNTLEFTAALSQNGYQYRTVFTNTAGQAVSDPATLMVHAPLHWQSTSPLLEKGYELAATSCGEYLYVIGGSDEGYYGSTRIEKSTINQDGSLQSFQRVGNLPQGLMGHQVFTTGNKIYIVGGNDSLWSIPKNDVLFTSLSSTGEVGSWQNGPALNQNRMFFGLAVVGSYVYVLGGTDNSSIFSSVEYAYINPDGSLGPWHLTAPMQTSRKYLGVFTSNGFIYAISGFSASGSRTGTVEYAPIQPDGSLGNWQYTSNVQTSRTLFSTVKDGNYVYIMGGTAYSSNTGLESVEMAEIKPDHTLGDWVYTTPLNRAEFGQATVVSRSAYLLGGYIMSGSIDLVEFSPLSTPSILPTVTGHVMDESGNPLAGVTISAGCGYEATTDEDGNYSLSGLTAGSYTLTPIFQNYEFLPESRSLYVNLDVDGQDFIGIPLFPVITSQPVDQIAMVGETVTFTASASGKPAPTVQWQTRADAGATWNDLDGETQTTLTFTAALSQNGYQYRAVFTNAAGQAITDPATLSILPADTTITLNASTTTPLLHQPVVFTALVNPAFPSAGLPSGSVTFKVGDIVLATVDLIDGTAIYTTADMTVGLHQITAVFIPSSNWNGSTSTPLYIHVGYRFSGFFSPVDNLPILNIANAGQTIPLKWRLLDYYHQPVTDLATSAVHVTVVTLACPIGATPDLVEEYSSGYSGLQNLGNGYYQWNWKTPKAYANSCKTLRLDIGEGIGSEHNANFQFK